MSNAAKRLYEQVLVVRCQTADPAALSELIKRYSPRLRFFLCKIANDSSADDLLQEVWVDVFGKIGRLREPAAFQAWVYRIARDKAYSRLPRRAKRCVPIETDVIDSHPEPSFSAEEAIEIRVALDQIAREFREVLLMRFIEDMSYEQISQVIAKPIGTVRSRLHYGKRALRAVLERGLHSKDGTS